MSVLTIAGVRPSDIGLQVLRGSQRPMLPTTRDRMLIIPGRNGAKDFGADMEPRQFNLDCAFMERNASELQYRAERLAAMLVDSYGKPRTVNLVFKVHPDRTYTVRYLGELPIERLVGYGRFTLPLMAFDPYAYGPENLFEDVIQTSPYVKVIESNGDIRTPPVIVLTNEGSETITSFTITNEYRLE